MRHAHPRPTANQIESKLTKLGVPHGKIRCLRESRVWSDQKKVVVKIGASDIGAKCEAQATRYLEALEDLEAAGVRCERPLHPEPVEFRTDVWGVVLGWVSRDEPSNADTMGRHARQLGAYVRAVHDALTESAAEVADGHVFCPEDWRPENVVINDGRPVMVDLDLMGEDERDYQRDKAASDLFADVSGRAPARAAFEREFLEGYGPL